MKEGCLGCFAFIGVTTFLFGLGVFALVVFFAAMIGGC